MNNYDRFVSQLRQSSLMFRSSYLDFKSKPSPFFDADRAFFVIHPQRNNFIRTAYCGEVDYTPDDQPFMELLPKLKHLNNIGMPDDIILSIWRYIPRLHCLVTRITPEIHHITVLLRGDAFWPSADEEGRDVDQFRSDADLAPVLKRIAEMDGFDIAAWQRFDAALTAATNKLIPRSTDARVH